MGIFFGRHTTEYYNIPDLNDIMSKSISRDVVYLSIADERFVPVLEEVPGAFVTAIEVNCIIGEKSSHERGKQSVTRA